MRLQSIFVNAHSMKFDHRWWKLSQHIIQLKRISLVELFLRLVVFSEGKPLLVESILPLVEGASNEAASILLGEWPLTKDQAPLFMGLYVRLVYLSTTSGVRNWECSSKLSLTHSMANDIRVSSGAAISGQWSSDACGNSRRFSMGPAMGEIHQFACGVWSTKRNNIFKIHITTLYAITTHTYK